MTKIMLYLWHMFKKKDLIMKLAIPVKMNRENSALSPLFGKAKWIAFVQDGEVDIQPNHTHGGGALVEWFIQEGVDTVIFQEMGHTPYQKIKSAGNITLFHAGNERILLDEALEKFEDNQLLLVDDTNIDAIIKHHEKKHSHGHTH